MNIAAIKLIIQAIFVLLIISYTPEAKALSAKQRGLARTAYYCYTIVTEDLHTVTTDARGETA